MSTVCLIPTKPIIKVGEEAGITDPLEAAKAVAMWQSYTHNARGVLPNAAQLKTFAEENAKEIEVNSYTLPIHEIKEIPNVEGIKPGDSIINENTGVVTIQPINPGQQMKFLLGFGAILKKAGRPSKMQEYSSEKLFDSFPAMYAFSAFIRKEMYKRGVDEITAEVIMSAADSLKAYKAKLLENNDYTLADAAIEEESNRVVSGINRTLESAGQELYSEDELEVIKHEFIKFKTNELMGIKNPKKEEEMPWKQEVKQKIEIEEITDEETAEVPAPNKNIYLPLNPNSVNFNTGSRIEQLSKVFTPLERKSRVDALAYDFYAAIQSEINNMIDEQLDILDEDSGATENEQRAATALMEKLKDPEQGRAIVLSQPGGFEKIYAAVQRKYLSLKKQADNSSPEAARKYQDVIDNFEPLFQEAVAGIEELLGMRVVIKKVTRSDGNRTSQGEEGLTKPTHEEEQRVEDENDDHEGQNESETVSGTEWSYQIRFQNLWDTISKKAKAALNDIRMVSREDGKLEYVKDDLGRIRYYPAVRLHSILLSESSNMNYADDWMQKMPDGKYYYPLLESMREAYPWVEQLINKFVSDPQLASLFYNDLMKTRTSYWKMTYSQKRRADGGIDYIWKTFPINEDAAAESRFDELNTNYENLIRLNKLSLYDEYGGMSKENASKLKSIIGDISKRYEELEGLRAAKDERFSLSDYTELAGKLQSVVASIGISISNQEAMKIIRGSKEHPFKDTLSAISSLVDKVNKLKTDEAFKVRYTDHFKRDLRALFNKMNMIGDSIPNMSVREGEKNLPSYAAPNYIDILAKRLSASEEVRMKAIEAEFKGVDMFYNSKSGKYRIGWIQDMIDNPALAKQFKVHSLDNINGVEYADWSAPQIKQAFLRYYFRRENKNSTVKMAEYNMPIFSDSTTLNMITFQKFDEVDPDTGTQEWKEELIERFMTVIEQELIRMEQVHKRAKKIENGEVAPIDNFDKNGHLFHFLPHLNELEYNGIPFKTALLEARNSSTDTEAKTIMRFGIEAAMKYELELFMEDDVIIAEDGKLATEKQIASGQGFDFVRTVQEATQEEYKDEDGKIKYAQISVEQARAKIEEYVWNSYYAQTQIIQMTVSDPAYFKMDNGVDFQKRYKQIYAAGMAINPNSKYGKTHELSIYLADMFCTSRSLSAVIKNLNDGVKEGRMTETEAKKIIGDMQRINATDAQAFRTLPSMRSLLDMMGAWTEEMEATMNRFESGFWNFQDFEVIWQAIKPFVYATVKNRDGVGGTLRNPHQNKNSEYLLLALYDLVGEKASPKMRGLNRFMVQRGIDVAQFGSAVKCGGQGLIDINTSPNIMKGLLALKNSAIDSHDALTEIVKSRKAEFGEDDKFYKIYQGLKDRFDEDKSLADRFFAFRDSVKNDTFNSFSTLKQVMDAKLANNEMSQEEYNSFLELFEPTENEVVKMLEDSTMGDEAKNEKDVDAPNFGFNPEVVHALPYERYVVQQPSKEHLFDVDVIFGSQFRNLITADLPENITIKLTDDITLKGAKEVKSVYQALLIQNLMDGYKDVLDEFSSIEKLQKVLLQTIEGNPKYGREFKDALAIVDTPYGKTFNIPLNSPTVAMKMQEILCSIVKKSVTKQKIKGGTATLVSNVGYTNELEIKRDPKTGALIEVQCKLPWYSQRYFAHYMTTDTKTGKQFIDIKKIEAEDPKLLELIGYRIPTEAKYSMVPLRIVGFLPQQNGGAIMLPADLTTISGQDYDIDKLFLMLPEFRVFTHDKSKAIKDAETVLGRKLDFKNKEDAEYFDKVYAEAKKEGKYRYTNKSTGQTYEKIKRLDYKTTDASKLTRQQRNNLIIDIARGILQDPVIGEHFSSPGNFDSIKRGAREAEIMNSPKMINEIKDIIAKRDNVDPKTVGAEAVFNWIKEASTKDLSSFVAKYARLRSSASISSFTYFHRQNMVGAKLIGMYANNTTMQAKSQGLDVGINPEFAISVNGRILDKFTEVYHNNGKYDMRISKNCAEFSAASVDNAKDPVLASLLQDTDTANITGAMLRMGMTVDEISAIYSNPILRANLRPDGAGIEGVKNYIKAWQEVAKKKKVPFEIGRKMNTDFLKIAIIDKAGKDIYNLEEMTDSSAISLVKAAGIFVEYLAPLGGTSGNITSVSRADTPKGALQNTFAKALVKQAKLDRERILAEMDKNYPLTHAERLMPINDVFEDAEKESNGQGNTLLQAFHSLGIDQPMNDIFPIHYAPLNGIWRVAINELISNNNFNIGARTMEKFMNEMSTFALSKTELFGDETMPDGTVMTYAEKRDYYLKRFPHIFDNLKKQLPYLKKLQVINKLILSEEGFATLKFIGTTSARSKNRDAYISELESLFTLTDSKGNDVSAAGAQIARDLLRFTYYKYGLNFGPNSLGSLMSPAFLNHFPEYTAALRSMGRDFGVEDATNFYMQFISQNSYTSVPRRTSTTEGVNADGEVWLPKSKNTSIDGRFFKFINFNGELFIQNGVDDANDKIKYKRIPSVKLFNSTYNANVTAAELCESMSAYDMNNDEGIEGLIEELGLRGETEQAEELKQEVKEKNELIEEEQKEQKQREDSEKRASEKAPSKYSAEEGNKEAGEIKCEN
jgi:hypothetical protein